MKARKFASRARLIPTAKPFTLNNRSNPAKSGDQDLVPFPFCGWGRLPSPAPYCRGCSIRLAYATTSRFWYFGASRFECIQERPLKFRQPVLAVTALFVLALPIANAQVDEATKQLSHDIFKELIEINTTDSVG